MSQAVNLLRRMCADGHAHVVCLHWSLALGEVKESKLLLAFGQCKMKLVDSSIHFSKRRLILKNK